MLFQALRIRQHTSIRRLLLHQNFKRTVTHRFQPKKESRTALVRLWEPFYSFADSWALIRAIELKYGKIIETIFRKDFEISTRHQILFHVIFRYQESLERIPKNGISFHIPAPVVIDRPGGPGLDDIRHLLESTDIDESFEFPTAASHELNPNEKIIGAHIIRCNDFFTIPALGDIEQQIKVEIAKPFLRWGGFYNRDQSAAIKTSRFTREGEWFRKPNPEQLRMQEVLENCSQITGFPVPRNRKNSSPASAPIDPSGSSSPTTLDIPISHKSTSKSTQSSSLLTEAPQPSSLSSPELTQLPPEPTPPLKPTIPPSESTPPKPTIPPPEPTPTIPPSESTPPKPTIPPSKSTPPKPTIPSSKPTPPKPTIPPPKPTPTIPPSKSTPPKPTIPPSKSTPPKPTIPSSKSTPPKPTIPPSKSTPPKPTIRPGQLNNLEQKKALQIQMSKAKQFVVDTKKRTKNAQKPKKVPEPGKKDQMPHAQDKSPENPSPLQSKLNRFWEFFGQKH